MEQLVKIINVVLENRGRKRVENITSSSHLRNDLGFDSLDLAELTVRVEAELDVDIFEDGIVVTVGDVLDKLSKR